MLVEKNVPLQPYNTFGIAARAQTLVRVRGLQDLQALMADAELGRSPSGCWAAAATSCSPATCATWC
jgi:UDP-N-acetylenolpyruvoylglucosamine reductase